jgi:S-DNA-T family DNA segregation ATPase FtsK/SpoIIIE
MHRAEVETWPADAEKVGTGPAGALDLWVADAGALSKSAPEYPLLHEGVADVFKGVPGGVSPRGDALTIPIVGKNFVAGGQMGQGKSNACRVILLGCALDPICEIDAFVFAANGDFDAYRKRLSHYHRGVEDETAYAALERLRWLYGEVARREGRLAELGAKKVTRGLAEKHDDLRPIVSLYSECHELFGHPEVGEEAGELACKTAKRARKTAIVLGFDTQSSRKEAIPPKLVELMSVNVCFYVKTWRSNDGFLGDGAFQAGIRATELRPGRDVGTSVTIGVSDNTFELLKWYFVEVNDDTGFDAAADVIARAVANLAPGTRVAGEVRAPVEVVERDLLEDLDEVLGAERVRLADVPALLRDLAPDWAAYRPLTGKELRDLLSKEGVRTVKTGNVAYLDPQEVRRAVAERSTADPNGAR